MRIILKTLTGVVFVFLLAGCGGGESTSSTSKADIVPIYTPPSGGINYVISAGVADVINQGNSDKTSNQISVEAMQGATDGVTRMIELYEQDRPSIGAYAYEAIDKMYNGESELLDGEYTELRAIGYLSETALHMVVAGNSSIQSMADLEGKRVGTAIPGDTMYYFIRDLLEDEYGLIENEDYQSIPLSYTEVQDGIKNGSIDAGLIMGMPPAPAVSELAQTEDIRVLSIEPEKMESFLEGKPYYSSVEVEKGTYPGQEEDVLIGSFSSLYFTHDKMKDEEIYAFLETIFENQEHLQSVHSTFDIDEESVTKNIELPFHPGAIEFFEDQGIEWEE
ncbi:TRAP transporter solute receptor, TAXI family [Alteribacillus persepolensis]|uniref:TRAP transporter solute receptor, TAXI family n=1 Tax=Alteribacillus persepolensis TaxID=568899 RepID=A0A1G7Y616_9BACI|nr:TAXI family TRAP transporter solute-binding subunit [Alteribacillus persepolensis]SDG91918.1 TRAP transporter solute receptor, TAXI family [Alteribacillus persepolensis]